VTIAGTYPLSTASTRIAIAIGVKRNFEWHWQLLSYSCFLEHSNVWTPANSRAPRPNAQRRSGRLRDLSLLFVQRHAASLSFELTHTYHMVTLTEVLSPLGMRNLDEFYKTNTYSP